MKMKDVRWELAWWAAFVCAVAPQWCLSPARAETPIDPPAHARGGPGLEPGPNIPDLPPQFGALLEAMKVAAGDNLLSSFNYPALPQEPEDAAALGNLRVGALRPNAPTSLNSTVTVSLTAIEGETQGILTITPKTGSGEISTRMVLARGGVMWTLDQDLFLEGGVLRSFGGLKAEGLSSGITFFDGRGGWRAPGDGGGGMIPDEASDAGFHDEAANMTSEAGEICPAWDCGVFVAVMIIVVVVVAVVCAIGMWFGWWSCSVDWLKEHIIRPMHEIFLPAAPGKDVACA